jgi:AcrR family transcriptional regulator
MRFSAAPVTNAGREPALKTQHGRILDAMVQVVHERGYARTSVSSVSARAKLSRRTFYEVFDSLEDCFLAFMDQATQHASGLISQTFEGKDSWLDGVRAALASLLAFFDSEPILAHVMLVEASEAGARARERRARHLATLTSLIEDRWGAPKDGHPHSLVPAGVMASLLGILHAHLVTQPEEPLIALLGPLMGVVTAPYLDQPGVRREAQRGDVLARELLVGSSEHQRQSPRESVEVPELLCNPRAHRARACLLYVAEHPQASNRQIARSIGIARDAHISTLLARLHGLGLIVKHSSRRGGPNAWSPSAHGQQVARSLTLPTARMRSGAHVA